MLSVLMDGIKDANMLLDYADASYNEDDNTAMQWFKSHAKERIDGVSKDYDYICSHIGLVEKARSGDEIADALISHLTYQMQEINKRYASM